MCEQMAVGPLGKDPGNYLPTCSRDPSHWKPDRFASTDPESEVIQVPETGQEIMPL